MRYIFIVMPLALGACSSEVDRAEKELTFLRENKGTPRELCTAAGKVTEAAMKAGDAQRYKYAQNSKTAECTTLDVFPAYADIPGGVPKASDEEIANQFAALNLTDTK